MNNRLVFLWMAVISVFVFSGQRGLAITFSFPIGSPLSETDLMTAPCVTTNGITLTAVSAAAPFSFAENYPDGTQSVCTLHCAGGLGVNNQKISNADFSSLVGASDVTSEGNALNFLESMTFRFDRSVVFSQIRVNDLEAGEKLTVSIESGPSAVLTNNTVWSIGGSGNTVITGNGLGALKNYVIKRNAEVTFAFDTIDPLNRISNGNGSNLSGTPSVILTDFNVEIPVVFGLGAPFAVKGSSTQATVGCELWGNTGTVSLVWSTNQTVWAYTNRFGTLAPQLFTNAVMTNLSAGRVYYYAFFATNTAGTKVWSATNIFAWATNLYVSPVYGSDTNSGLCTNVPLQSLKEVLKRIQSMARRPQPQMAAPPDDLYTNYPVASSNYAAQLDAHLTNLVDAVTVKLMPGLYQLDETLVMDSKTGGNIQFEGEWVPGAEEALKNLLNEHGEDSLWMNPPDQYMPVISGGRAVTNWTETVINGVAAWVADLPAVREGSWYFKQLFVDGKRAERSRWPKKGWFRMEEINATNWLTFKAFPGHMQSWTNLNNAETVILHRWFEDRLSITNYNTATRWVQLAGPVPTYDLSASDSSHGTNTAAYYVDHVFETMSEPGEWYLNRPEGKLYYIPRVGEMMAATRVTAPALRQLIQVSGLLLSTNSTGTNYLWNTGFKRIAFMHTRVDDLAVHSGSANTPSQIGEGALQFTAVRWPRVEACLFGHMGEAGVKFSLQTMRGELSCNLFRDMAGSAIVSEQNTADTVQLFERNGFLLIHDNDIRGYGRFWHGNVGVLLTTIYSVIEHNHLRDAYYNGMRISGCGDTVNEFGFGNIIRKNRIHHIGQGWLSDLNGIYVVRVCPYTVVEGNVVHDIQARDYTSPAIYLDGNAHYITVRNNWAYNCNVNNFTYKGWVLTVTNNVFANAGEWNAMRHNNGADPDDNDPGWDFLSPTFAASRQPPVLSQNIYFQQGGGGYDHEDYTQTPSTNWSDSDTNLFYDSTTTNMVIGMTNRTLTAWQLLDQRDGHSIQTDPLFVDPFHGDFRVPTNSPAVTQLGFVPFDNRDAGPRSNEWAAAGAVWYSSTGDELPAGVPSDVPGLQFWLDAADLTAGPLAEWKTKTPYSYTMRQFDRAAQPEVVASGLRGLPVVRFSGRQWMGNQEYLWDARQYAGRFENRPFTIFTVHRAAGVGIVLTKGNGAAGKWSIGKQANSLRWDSTNYLGASGTDWKVRVWQCNTNDFRYYENGVLAGSSTKSPAATFSTDDEVYLGGNSNTASYLTGDIAEVLIYLGTLSSNNFTLINTYLNDKWLPRAAPFIANESGAVPGLCSVTLRGELTVDPAAKVVFYWGTSDGGTNATDWEHAVTNESALSGPVSVLVTQLPSSQSYYYRCFAQNGSGSVWSASTAAFRTPAAQLAEPAMVYTNRLQLWLAADDLDGDGTANGVVEQGVWAGRVSAWVDKSANGYRFVQTDKAHQPAFILNGTNPPVLRFSAAETNWVGNAAGELGRFGTNDFAIFTVHKSVSGDRTVIGKGSYGGNGDWELGPAQNQFRWNGTNYIGLAGTGISIRCYQRASGSIKYYENNACFQTSTVDGNYNFTSSLPLYIGRRGNVSSRPLSGDVAEILIYTGTVSSADSGRITDYLGRKWLGWTLATPRGTPYEWLERYGITVNHDVQDDVDADGDGFKTWQEYWAGTDPSKGVSFFHITGISFSGGTASVSWYGADSGSSVPWSMYVSTNLAPGSWILVASNSIPRNPQNGTNTWQDNASTNAPLRFYRPAVLPYRMASQYFPFGGGSSVEEISGLILQSNFS